MLQAFLRPRILSTGKRRTFVLDIVAATISVELWRKIICKKEGRTSMTKVFRKQCLWDRTFNTSTNLSAADVHLMGRTQHHQERLLRKDVFHVLLIPSKEKHGLYIHEFTSAPLT